MNNEWITDRRPTEEDSDCMGHVYVTRDDGIVSWQWWATVSKRPWMPIVQPEPYVKPKRYGLRENYPGSGKFVVYDTDNGLICSSYLPTSEAAERIAAIYEEVMP